MAYNLPIYTKGTVSYKDLDMSFLSNPSTGDIRVKTDADAVKQSIKNLVLMNYGDIPFRPRQGGNMDGLLFEPLDDITIDLVQSSIISTINAYEPRAQLLAVNVNASPDQNQLDVVVKFTLINAQAPQQLSLILKRSR